MGVSTKMTLEQWVKTFQQKVECHPRSGGLYVLPHPADRGYVELFHLADYAVSSVTGGPTVWLVPRRKRGKLC